MFILAVAKTNNTFERGLINVKIKHNEYFLWCHINKLNVINKHTHNMVEKFDYKDIVFPVSKTSCQKVELKNSI